MTISQLSRLLPLPEEELQQIVDYASTVSKAEATNYLRGLLGDSPEAIGFVSTFNGGRQDGGSASSSGVEAVPKATRGPKKKKAPLHMPQPRRVENYDLGPGTVYNKRDGEDEYMAALKRPSPKPSPAPAKDIKSQAPTKPTKTQNQAQQGFLISDISTKKSKSTASSRTSTPKPGVAESRKGTPAGKTQMSGAAAAIADLDAAIRLLEMTTNPNLKADTGRRRCECGGTRHQVQAAAPNCLSCGKVICVDEGLGPCSDCGTPLLTAEETHAMIRELKEERGRERMALHREAHRRPGMQQTHSPGPATGGPATGPTPSEAEAKARDLRDRLLGYQEQNARRTTIKDEESAYDFTAVIGGPSNMWSTAEERAMELKRQQKLRREVDWDSRPDYEKRQQVVSIDLIGGKVVKKMAARERPPTPDDEVDQEGVLQEFDGNKGSGSRPDRRNPMGRRVMKPGLDLGGLNHDDASVATSGRSQWAEARVQDLNEIGPQKDADARSLSYLYLSTHAIANDSLAIAKMSYADAAAKGPKQSPEEAAAPQQPEVIPVETASTASLVDVDMPSVRTVPSDFKEQDVQTETQAARLEREQDAAATAKDKVKARAAKAKSTADRADSWIMSKFSALSDDGAKGLAITNMVGFLSVSAFLGYKAWGLYEKGRLGWKEVGIGMGVMSAVGLGEAIFGGYLIRAKGKKN